jgi:hypothetical protein
MTFLVGVDLLEYLKDFPDIIRAAAGSQLGILALMVSGLSVLGYLFFKNAGAKVTVPIFLVLFCGVVAFCVAYFNEANETSRANEATHPPITIEPNYQITDKQPHT